MTEQVLDIVTALTVRGLTLNTSSPSFLSFVGSSLMENFSSFEAKMTNSLNVQTPEIPVGNIALSSANSVGRATSSWNFLVTLLSLWTWLSRERKTELEEKVGMPFSSDFHSPSGSESGALAFYEEYHPWSYNNAESSHLNISTSFATYVVCAVLRRLVAVPSGLLLRSDVPDFLSLTESPWPK